MGDRIALGIIRKPHGVRGEVSVEPWTDSVDRFTEIAKEVTLVSPDDVMTRDATIESVRDHRGRALIKFAGIETPETADELRGWTIEIPESQARKLDENEFFLHDLVGMKLVDANGREKGVVTDAYEGGGGTLLEVTRGRRKFDVPFAADICTSVDLASKTIVVNLPVGLDEV
jgi:16S rRNA processing protein RimM